MTGAVLGDASDLISIERILHWAIGSLTSLRTSMSLQKMKKHNVQRTLRLLGELLDFLLLTGDLVLKAAQSFSALGFLLSLCRQVGLEFLLFAVALGASLTQCRDVVRDSHQVRKEVLSHREQGARVSLFRFFGNEGLEIVRALLGV